MCTGRAPSSTLVPCTPLLRSGGENFIVTGLKGNLDAGTLTGTLTVTTVDVSDIAITTGVGANTINAQALADGHAVVRRVRLAATARSTADDHDATAYTCRVPL